MKHRDLISVATTIKRERVSHNTQSWQFLKENKFEVVTEGINFTAKFAFVIVTAQLGETPASDWQSLRQLFARGRLANVAVQATACTRVMVQG